MGDFKKGNRYSIEFKKQVCEYSVDNSYADTAKKFGVHYNSIKDWRKALGYPNLGSGYRLGFGEEIDVKFRSPESTSEAELALWLSQPQQMGVPPTNVEVLHSMRCLWPSFNDPIDVSLVRFEYNFGERSYSNVGITGPVTFAMSSDLSDLSLGDAYAIYAGWHAEHEEIFTLTSENWNDLQREQLEQSADLAGDTRRVTRDARRTLKAIAWKVFREKLTLIGTIACLLAIDFALAYRLVSNHGRL